MVNHKTNILQKHGWVEIKPSNVTLKHLDSVISLNHSINLEIMDKFPNLDLLQNEFIEASKTSILRYSNQSKNFVKSMIVDLLKDHSYLKEYFIQSQKMQ